MAITINPRKPFCVYSHNLYGKIVYIGAGTLKRAFELTGRGERWHRSMTNPDIPWVEYEVEILESFETYPEALIREAALIAEHQPSFNVQGIAAATRKRLLTKVKCVETGSIYPTITKAAEAIGVTPGAISNHLNGRQGYEHIKRLHFQRVDD